jgi:signal transduction histidine kinase
VLLTRRSINKLLDLDLALIEDAYQAEFTDRQRRAERLATIGQVAGGIAHELRNPLNVIKTSIYFLQNAKNAPPEKVASHLERIDRQTTLADHVITALHDFARLPLPKLAEVSLGAWLPELLREASLPSTIEVACDVPADLPPVLADPLQLRIVFANLVRNAQEAMAGGGKLSLRARRAGNLVQVEVADTGSGMSPDDLMRVMEPFHSTKARGLGLGLAIVKAIVEKHQGRITVASVPGEGTTFILALPASLPSA